jgi:hypothetical protein
MNHENLMRVLSDPLAKELTESNIPARLAYTGLDGFPRAIPIGYFFDGSRFFACTASSTPKVAAISANPHVALTIDTEGFPPHILLVRGVATVEIVPGIPEEYWAASRKGVPAEGWDAFVEGVKQTYDEMARITIEPQWAKLMDFETRLPDFHTKLMRSRQTS